MQIGVCLIWFFAGCHAYQSYQGSIPNGNKVIHPCNTNEVWNGVGHRHAIGGGELNTFGTDLYQTKIKTGQIWTKTLCELDSDGDGLSNGEELGDPKCEWLQGNDDVLLSNVTVTHPGICEPMNSRNCWNKNKWLQCNDLQLNCPAIDDPDVKTVTLRIPQTQVQKSGSRYICTFFDVPVEGNFSIIASKYLINNTRVVHHMAVFGCDDTENPPRARDPQKCENNDGPPNCQVVMGWTAGSKEICYPFDTGVALGSHGYRRFMIEIHWHNNEDRSDYTDSSGVLFYYTSHLRKYNSGTLLVGDVSLSLPPGKKKAQVEGICYGQCTLGMLKGPIYIYYGYHHMHLLGRQQMIQQYRKGKLIKTVTNETDFSFRRYKEFAPTTPVEVLPGDELRTVCVYDTISKNTTTRFGWGTDEEMCVAVLNFYPAENLKAMSSLASKSYCVSWMKLPQCTLYKALSLT